MTPALLSDTEIQTRLEGTDWTRDGAEIVREHKFDDFKQAIEFVNRVAEVAEQLGHHPDILVHGWNNVRLTVSTHSAGGLTESDFKLAQQVDRLT